MGGMPTTLDGWRHGLSFIDLLQKICADNFGAAGTRSLFKRLNILEAPASFIQRAQHRITQVMQEADLRKDTFGLAHKRVLCYGEWDVITDSGEPLRGTLLQENGIRVGHT